MTSNENIVNYKAIDLLGIYNICLNVIPIWGSIGGGSIVLQIFDMEFLF